MNKDTAALRAQLVEKLLVNAKDIEQALTANNTNPFLQTLFMELKNVQLYVASSSISDAKLQEYLTLIDETVKNLKAAPAKPAPAPIAAKAAPAKQAAPAPAPTAAPAADDDVPVFGEAKHDFADSLLGLDLEGVLGDILSDSEAMSDAFTEADDSILRIDGDKIVLEIDEELEQSIDEEAKMFEVEQHYRNKDYFKALTVALALNIRFKQGVGRRSDAIVKRQDEILFDCNYRIGYNHLEAVKTSKGDDQVENKLSAVMHFYTALDQQALKGQEEVRQKVKAAIDSLTEKEGVTGPAYVKAGLFKKIKVPSPEDKAQKSFYWKERAMKETDLVRKEFYWLMTFSSDLNYYPYQIALANFYIEVGRLDEACRYIKVPLPLVENDGLDFLLTLRKKDASYAEKFMERRFKSDTKQLRTRFEQPDKKEVMEKDEMKKAQMENLRFRKFLEAIDLWQKRMDSMKGDVPFRQTSLRVEYTKAFAELIAEANKVRPDVVVRDYIERYRSTDVRSTQNPNILNFIDFSFRYSVVPDEKSITGLSVEGDAEAALTNLTKSVLDYFNTEIGISSKSIAEVKHKVNQDTESLTKAMKALGYKFTKIPTLTKS
jgi:hypothetical protein